MRNRREKTTTTTPNTHTPCWINSALFLLSQTVYGHVYWYAWTVLNHSHYRDKVSFLRPVVALSPLPPSQILCRCSWSAQNPVKNPMEKKNRPNKKYRWIYDEEESNGKHSSDCILHTFLLHLTNTHKTLAHAIWISCNSACIFSFLFFLSVPFVSSVHVINVFVDEWESMLAQ